MVVENEDVLLNPTSRPLNRFFPLATRTPGRRLCRTLMLAKPALSWTRGRGANACAALALGSRLRLRLRASSRSEATDPAR